MKLNGVVMAEYFVYEFEEGLPRTPLEQEWEKYDGKPLLGDVVAEAHGVIAGIEPFQTLPERNQKLILDMAEFAMVRANSISDEWRENFWGLYVIGSRARADAQASSDLDLLSVGTFYYDQGFSSWTEGPGIFEGFSLETPSELPNEYNVGDVDRKYLVRATPDEKGVLPVDLSVVDLTFWDSTLDGFKESLDIAEDGSQLPRVPMFELTVPEERLDQIW